MASNDPQVLKLDDKIAEFLKEQSVVTIATSVNNHPYCASCYYAFVPGDNLLVFKSDTDTKHIENALQNAQVAGTVLPDKIVKAKPKGVQFNGTFMKAEGSNGKKAKEAYLKKYPVAGIFRGDIWVIELSKIKFTDNTLVFGKKILWER
ncbi:MAG: pyridoxamine 5'-phosphate oxidase family protein [Chitinophagaceae bacterium]|nr:pyridoxamine 5'-phosphate oxidase family protein [Chitinophagaceae bacterium]